MQRNWWSDWTPRPGAVFDDVIQLPDEYQTEAKEIRDSVCQALQADEYAVALATALRDAQAGAVQAAFRGRQEREATGTAARYQDPAPPSIRQSPARQRLAKARTTV